MVTDQEAKGNNVRRREGEVDKAADEKSKVVRGMSEREESRVDP